MMSCVMNGEIAVILSCSHFCYYLTSTYSVWSMIRGLHIQCSCLLNDGNNIDALCCVTMM